MNVAEISQVALPLLTQFGLRVLGAIALWIIAQWLIDFGLKLLRRAFRNKHIEPTLVNYIVNIVNVILKIVLIVAILGFFGIETTSFAALLAAAGIAIGAAWSGLLANFAAGAFLIIFRPFMVGDTIQAAGVTGTVEEIGLFTTTINTLDNVRTIIGNNKIFADNIQNFSANPYRRVDLQAQLHHAVDPADAIGRLKERISQIPHVLNNPAPDVEILEFNLAGPVLAVRPYCHNENYWQVYFDTNKIIKETFGQAGYPIPEQRYMFSGQSPDGTSANVVQRTSLGKG
ncbi:mechanosensitive ion channel family protein [Nostoc parmelioides]|uniref:Mechanosensitive ion channel family protein n=1 Tax=Nostoc parmelioides FACHB-3921 TaxID=2692909 RepID=A0ABR8BD90_9NOSO|nr:mechanosensitive ion channel family protein [Nostoc parmelioides]MBD2251679.1 mechanosensitive ion channel family protein [Nostoc parmelioides FACHB-3921]